MTRGIEDMLNLPHMDDMLKGKGIDHQEEEDAGIDLDALSENDQAAVGASLDLMGMAAQKLATVEGTDHAKSMDVIYKETLDHARNLMDLAYNVDERSRRGILEIATAMYKNSIDAKNSKREMQLKVMQIMQNQQKIELDEKKFRAEMGEEIVKSESVMVEDRNDLIKRIRQQAKDERAEQDEKDNPAK
jgi:hypothetical protein